MPESSIINNDSALPIPRQFARWLGMNEAGILQQLHWHTEQGHGQLIDGLRWIRMSENEWMEEIPLDEKAIQRAIKNLVSDGLIKSEAFIGRCKWYAVCYDKIEALAGPVDRIINKAQKRKDARASRKDSIPTELPDTVKVQSVPTAKEQNGGQVKEQNDPVKVQNVPLQETLQEYDSVLILNAHAREKLDRIGQLCRTNFFNPAKEPYKTSLLDAIQDFTADKVLWAIELALSPAKANGKAKAWGFVLAILENDKTGVYQNGTGNRPNSQQAYAQETQNQITTTPGGPSPGNREYASKQGGHLSGHSAQVSAALKRQSRGGSDPIKSPLPLLPEPANPPDRDISNT